MSSYAEELHCERGALHAEMRRDIGEDTREGADAEARVIRDSDVMLTALLRREPHVAPCLARHGVSIAAEHASELAAREIARETHHLRGDDFVVHQVESDRLRPLGVLVEVTAHGVADHHSELLEVISFGDDRRTDRVRDVPAFGGFLDDKQEFGHGASGRCRDDGAGGI